MVTNLLSPGMARAVAGLAASVAFALSSPPAAAQEVHAVQVGGDAVVGVVSDAADVDRIPFNAVEGALLSVTLKAAKGSALHPRLVVLGPDRREDAAATAALLVSPKGNQVALKSYPVPSTGLRWLEVRSADGSAGGWSLATKVKNPRGAAAAPTAAGDGATLSVRFVCPGNSVGTIVAKAAKGSGAVPAFVALREPDGDTVLVDPPLVKGASFTLKGVTLGPAGEYELLVSSPSGAAGPFTVSAKWKTGKLQRRTLDESQVITDPVVTDLDPVSGDPSQVIAATVIVDFAAPGARVVFRKPPSTVTVPASQVTVGESSLSFAQNLASFARGVYDVSVENPDGGSGKIDDAFEVFASPAYPASIDPGYGYDDQVVPTTIMGSFFVSGVIVSLVRGGETIPGTGVLGAGSQVSATFDLRGHTVGAWDLVMANPDAAVATLPAAFDLRNAPPSLFSISPNRNVDGPVTACALDGANFDPGATARLERSGETSVQGTGVVVAPDRVTATFDLTGKAFGGWDAVVRNADGPEARLAGGFRVVGPVAAASKSLGITNSADAPPAVCWNSTRSEYLVGWLDVDSGGTNFEVKAQRLDSAGAPVGSTVSVSAAASSVKKRTAAVCWDSFRDEYLVAWAEQKTVTPTTGKGGYHPSGSSATSLYEVEVQVLRASDLVPQGSNVQISDHTLYSGYYVDEFNNFRPALAYDAKARLWYVVWMQEWSILGLPSGTNTYYSADDYDVLYRTLDGSNGSLGNMSGIAFSPYHEGDPFAAWDPVNQQVLVSYNARGGSDSVPLEVLVWSSSGAPGQKVASSSNDDLADPAFAVDTDKGRILVTWTRVPASGARSVEANLANASTLAPIGNGTVVTSAGLDHHFLARPVYNDTEKDAYVAWTRLTTAGSLSVRQRRVDTAGSSGLALQGSESETSGQSGDEATPACVYASNPGEFAIFWLKTMSLSATGTYKGTASPGGTYRGKEIWLQRLR